MKTFIKTLFLTIIFVGCEQAIESPEQELRLDYGAISLGNSKGAKQPIQIFSKNEWEIKIPAEEADWLTFTPLQGKGNATVHAVTLTDNYGKPSRFAKVVIQLVNQPNIRKHLFVNRNDTTMLIKQQSK